LKHAVLIEHLNALIAPVRDVQPAMRIERDVVNQIRGVEFETINCHLSLATDAVEF
jgi:hypothetical protein